VPRDGLDRRAGARCSCCHCPLLRRKGAVSRFTRLIVQMGSLTVCLMNDQIASLNRCRQ
jgi:hypothetical protein